ncbi:type II secretion system protein [Candidatus Saccharibacteria bacterium]|nr:type II secretion system protein [Candidatus Saccharibacteria bacterium]
MKKGFAIVEFVIVAVFLSLLFVLVMIQKADVEAFSRDEERKTAVNAFYYALEESFYAEHKYYPEVIAAEVLPVVEAKLFVDPSGYALGDSLSSYSYQAVNCVNAKCQGYTLKAKLEKEDTFVKQNREH